MTIASSIPVLRVEDYSASKAFWTDVMGFSIAEEGGSPARFGIFKREAATVFVDSWHGGDAEPSPGWRAYFHLGDVDAFAAEIKAKGADFDGPVDAVYGMREIVVRDPAGNRLCFGQDI